MKENLPFDDFVKEQFSNYIPNVPEHIWENIVLAKRNKKPKGFWWNYITGKNILIFSLAILMGSGSYILFSEKKNQKKNQEAKNVLNQKQAPFSPTNDNAEKKANKKNIDQGAKSIGKEGPEGQTDQNANVGWPTNPASKNANLNSELSNISNQNNFSKPPVQKNIIAEPQIGDLDKEALTLEKSVEQNREVLINKLTFPLSFNNARALSGTQKISSLTMKLPDCPAIEKNAAGNKIYWEIYAGPDYASGNYKTFGDTASNNYLQRRKESTQFSSAFSAGVRYTKVFDNGMSARAGANYSQINEKFIFFNPNEIRYVTVITTRVVVRQPGDTLYINDTLQYQQTGARTKTTYNRYRTIDIPLTIGYELGNGKIHADINAGIIINVYSWYKGDELDSTYQPVSITTGKSNSIYQFKTNIGIGFLGSVSVYYKLTDKTHLLLEPYFRYNLSPMSKENLNLQQKYTTVGVRAGLRFDLK